MDSFGDGFEFGIDADGLEAFDEKEGLLIGDVLIAGAVDGEDGGGVGVNPIEGAGAEVGVESMLAVTTDEGRDGFGGVATAFVRAAEIGTTVEADGAIDAAGLIKMGAFTFERRDIAGDGEELGPGGTGGGADGTHVGGIKVIFGGVGTEEADGGFDVVKREGELVMGRETVGDGGGNVAVLGKANGEGKIALAVAAAEAAAVDQNDTGMVAGGLGTDDVHAELIVGDGSK